MDVNIAAGRGGDTAPHGDHAAALTQRLDLGGGRLLLPYGVEDRHVRCFIAQEIRDLSLLDIRLSSTVVLDQPPALLGAEVGQLGEKCGAKGIAGGPKHHRHSGALPGGRRGALLRRGRGRVQHTKKDSNTQDQ